MGDPGPCVSTGDGEIATGTCLQTGTQYTVAGDCGGTAEEGDQTDVLGLDQEAEIYKVKRPKYKRAVLPLGPKPNF